MAETDWREELDGWLGPFLAALNHEKRRHWAPVYLQGLLGPGERKSLQPMAARLGQKGHDQLHHFIASPAWSDAPLRRLLVAKADALVGGPDAVLVVDDTALPKQGTLSVGVARQYCGRLGKKANCQVLVSLTLARGEVPVPLGLRLFLPDEWVADPDRCARAGVPDEHRRAEAKTDIALAEVDRVLAAGARFGAVLADAGHGTGAAFRRGLSARSLVWAVGVLKTQNVYPPTIELRWPAARTGRPRKHPVPSEAPVAAEAMLAGVAWRRVSWRRGTKGPLAAAFAALRVRPAEGAQLRDGRHLPGDEVWLVGERRASGERRYYLSNLPAEASLGELAALIKARWVCEQAHQQLKEELGLDHFEGRSWIGLHRHALMTMIAFCFLQRLRLAARGEKRTRTAERAPTTADLTGGPAPASRSVPPRPRPLPVPRN
ncbi:MAG TPA: IS701 family transposase [Geminicoccaceae bacterium]|nr:IS701 family transposase [Geminicoccaceae bacterium]